MACEGLWDVSRGGSKVTCAVQYNEGKLSKASHTQRKSKRRERDV